MPQFETGAAAVRARESEWETFRRLITHDDRNSYYIVSSNKGGTWEDVAVRKGNLPVLGFAPGASYYMTHNGFFAPNRRAESARQLNALFFDLDCHDRGAAETRAVVERTISVLRDAVNGGSLPCPTMIVDSGRGVQLFYVLHRSVPTFFNGQANSKSVSFFEGVQRKMADVLENLLASVDGISVDRATGDISRVSRIPGTYNASAGRRAKLVEASEELHSLSNLSTFATQYLLTHGNAAVSRAPRKTGATMLRYEPLMISRLGKVMELQAYRQFKCEGTRELMSFVFYNTAVQIYRREDARLRLAAFNGRFENPLDESELEGIRRSVDGVVNHKGQEGFYLIGAQRLTEMLALTPEENEAVNFFESKRAILRADAKRSTATKRNLRNQRILELKRSTNMTQLEIADNVGVSVRTVASVLAAEKIKRKQQALGKLTASHEARIGVLLGKRNKHQEDNHNNECGKTCNFLSYVSLEYSDSSLGSAQGINSFASIAAPCFLQRETPMTETFVAGTSVIGAWWLSYLRKLSLTSVRCLE
jgi:DNA-binding transcriptional regulator YiaG